VHNFSELFYIRNIQNPYYTHTAINVFGKASFIGFEKSKTDTIKGQNRESFLEYTKDEPSLEEAGIKWFPPYMIKVNKIDYTKFYKSVQHMNLKDPRKQK
jgi:hypothetical protein